MVGVRIALQGGAPGVKSNFSHGVTQHLELQEPRPGVHGGATWSGGVPSTRIEEESYPALHRPCHPLICLFCAVCSLPVCPCCRSSSGPCMQAQVE